jgi:assimilatory nitrate reductase catalytic subunit
MQVCTTCPYCGVGCGVIATHDAKGTHITGDVTHPANLGRLCVKGSSLADTLDKPNRLLQPQINGKAADWATATATVAAGFKRIRQQYGPEAIGFYLSGQLMTEDYYAANKLMKGFLGSSNVDTNSRLCMSAAVAAHKRAFGEDLVPGCYEDLEQADMIVLVGSNMAYTHPVIFQRILAAKQARPELYIVAIDPRRTATCEMADLHLALAPGSDGLLFSGLLSYLAETDSLDNDFIGQHTEGFQATLASAQAQAPTTAATAQLCDVDEADLRGFFERFAATAKIVTAFCQGINQSGTGADDGNTIINCHLASGKIGKPGSTPFSITGQPNAMGGREVGGMANTLAAHMDFEEDNVARVAEFWQATDMASAPGLKAVEMMEAVHAGKIKALWIMATNPAVSMPDANFVREALQRCELLVVSDCVANTDTAKLADVLLPAATWGERTGSVTNSERRVSVQRGFLPPAGESKPDWQIVSEVAREMGFTEAFDYQHPADIFREHAALSAFQNTGQRAFNLEDKQNLSTEDYLAMQPFQWPNNTQRLFTDGQFSTPSGRANFVPVLAQRSNRARNPDALTLNTGRIRDQWHTMTRTGPAPVLFNHIQEPYLQIHPEDAALHKLEDRSLARIHNRQSEVIARVAISADQRPGEVFIPIHWNDSFSSKARVSTLVPRLVDPVSGQPQFKQAKVAVSPFPAILEGTLLLDQSLGESWRPSSGYWSRVSIDRGVKFYLAETQLEQSVLMAANIRSEFKEIDSWVMLSNQADQGISLGGFIGEKLALALFTATRSHDLPDTAAIAAWLGKPVAMEQRFPLLEGNSADFAAKGPIICSCHQVGEFEINAEIDKGACTTAALGQALKCGTKCGSCVPELQKLLGQHKRANAQPDSKTNSSNETTPQ